MLFPSFAKETVELPGQTKVKHNRLMMEESTVDPAIGDVTESIAFGLLNDAEKLGQVLNGGRIVDLS